jgi:alpha-tubulin suppressor-like RCC1 family protein
VAGGLAFRQISAGTVRTCGIATTGETYCWGAGFGPAPTAIAGGARFTQVSAGRSHQCGVTADADAYCWGDNSFGQLGTEAVPSRCAPAASAPCAAPEPVRVAGGLRFRQISAGALHSCGVTTAGAAYCWGLVTPDPSFGAAELGNAAYSNYRGAKGGSVLPVPVEGGFAFREVTAGFRGSCGVTTAGAAVCWGSNNFGQMGIGSTDPAFSTRPRMVWMPAAQGAPTLTEYDNVCALTTTGRIFCWGGYNFFGELGSSPVSKAGGPVHSRAVPTPVESPARRGHAVPASAP